ncbi:hypothetical protein [Streptomyces specialis]|uniref:hypothetical protein n=1 Tax=Streptomyces specialis TaxID=498367 RepID=UPI00073EEA60|nr:hypothetical protein [Streptomyces specialis]
MAFGEGRVYGVVKQILGLLEGVRDRLPEIDTTLDAVRADVHQLKLTAPSAGATDALHADIAGLKATVEGYRAEVAALRAEAEASRRAREEALARQARVEAAEAERRREEQSPAREATAEPQPASQRETAPEPSGAAPAAGRDDDHRDLLGIVAGVAYANLVCHRDTWAFLVERAATAEHFRLPADVVARPDGTVTVRLSGRALLAAVDSLWHTRLDRSPVTAALATEVYQRVAASLLDLEAVAEDGQAVPRIVIDNRPTPPAAGAEPAVE